MTNWIVLFYQTDNPFCAFKGGGTTVSQDPSPHGKPRQHLSEGRMAS